MGGAAVLGLIVLGISVATVLILAPYLIPFFEMLFPYMEQAFLIFIAVMIIFIIIFALAYLGVVIYVAIKHPMKVKKHGNYSVDDTKEAGRREEGKS